MIKYYYVKRTHKPFRRWMRYLGLGIFFLGIGTTLYILSPLLLWQVYFANSFASEGILTPIPKSDIVNMTDANNWFPTFQPKAANKPDVSLYTLSIPKINIRDAKVSTVNTDLAKNLVNYPGTSIPADPGNAVIFGHSTLPQLYNSNDYKTLFANIFKLEVGDKIYVTLKNKTYSYKIHSISVVDPSNTSIFSQDYDNSYLTLVTCTPPGTIWKRLIIKAELENLPAGRQEEKSYAE